MKIRIQHGRVIDPKNGTDAVQDICITDGKIVAPDTLFMADQTLDASGLIVCPGFVDICARLREPGYEYKATLESELRAAVAGGVTSLACPPDTDPALDEPGLIEMLKHRAQQMNLAQVYPLGALTQALKGQQITEMCELAEAGCVGFAQANQPVPDTQVILHAMQYASTFDFTLWLKAEDPYLAKNGSVHAGEMATRMGLVGIPTYAETVALYTLLQLAETTGVRLHICRLSTAEGIAMLAEAKRRGLRVSADASIQHLHLTDLDIEGFNTQCHVQPPLRSARDRDAIRAALQSGVLDALCSDHAPVDDDAKLATFSESETGASAIELLLPLTLKWAKETETPLMEALALLTHKPAQLLHIEAGHLSEGARADLCIFDASIYRQITRDTLHSQGKNTPFLHWQLPGIVRWTLVAGEVAYAAPAEP